MPLTFYVLLSLTGAVVGFFSGLVGIGGGILMFPLLYYLPPVFGFEVIGIKNITGLTMVQGFFASFTAMLFYKQCRLVNKPLVFVLGLSIFLSSLTGSFVSKTVADKTLLFIFGILAFTASVMMFIPRSYEKDDLTEESVDFNKTGACLTGIFIGFLLGLVGQAGAFIIIPILLYILKIPLRVALGSTLAIGLFSSTAGLIGKAATGQVPLYMSGALVLGAIPAAKIGSYISKKTNTKLLRWILAMIISATSIKIWSDIFF